MLFFARTAERSGGSGRNCKRKLQTKTPNENSKRKLQTKTSEENFSANCLFECAPIVDAREYHRIKSHETEQTPNGFYNHLLQNETRALLQLTAQEIGTEFPNREMATWKVMAKCAPSLNSRLNTVKSFLVLSPKSNLHVVSLSSEIVWALKMFKTEIAIEESFLRTVTSTGSESRSGLARENVQQLRQSRAELSQLC